MLIYLRKRIRVVVRPPPTPHCDPVWWRSGVTRPPSGSTSKQRVRCWECGIVHMWRDRLSWNGTYSECPDCGFDVAVEDV